MNPTPQTAAAKLDAMARASLHCCRDCRRDGFPQSAAAHLAAARDYRASARRCRRIEESAAEPTPTPQP